MPWSGGGAFSRTNGTNTGSQVWQDDESDGTLVVSTNHDTHDQDLSDGINACLTKNGENSPTADINFNSNKITGLAAGSGAGHSVRYEQVPKLSTANTYTNTQDFQSTVTLSSTASSAAVGPDLKLHRNSGSPAASDVLGKLYFDGEDDGGAQVTYAGVRTEIVTATASSHAGSLIVTTASGAAEVDRLTLTSGLQIGSPTGGDQGAGTINATAIYDDGVLVNSAAAGASLVLIESQSASASSSLDFSTSIDSTYNHYVIAVNNIRVATDGADLFLRVDSDSGASFDSGASNYKWSLHGNVEGTGADDGSGADTEITLNTGNIGNLATEAVSGFIHMHNPANASTYTTFTWQLAYASNAGNLYSVAGCGQRVNAQADNAFQLIASAGNLTSGTVALYGVKKS